MANFLESIFGRLQKAGDRVVLREIRGKEFVSISARGLLGQIRQVRAFLRGSGLQPGDRCALLGANSIRWAAFDFALMAEGVIVVPLYSRQAPADLVAMMKDCQPRMLFAGDAALSEGIAESWPEAPLRVLFDDVLKSTATADAASVADTPIARADADLVTIIYTSGTSGEPKGVCLNVGNITYMLRCTTERLNQLMGMMREPDRAFHYLPFNFAASWIILLSCFSRDSVLTLSTDLNNLADEIRLASPHYFLNVPTLLERVRRGVEENIAKQAAPVRALFARARVIWQRGRVGRWQLADRLRVALARKLIFSKIREGFGPNLRTLICGSAPLAPETQQFFMMLGIKVLQGYGLTETTGICTLDDPCVPVQPGYVGPAIADSEMEIGANDEIIVRGPHIFAGYWNRPEDTARVMQNGWLHTGDQGEVTVTGNWRIVGRLKNLIILNSGHNIAPEPVEDKIAQSLPAGSQIVLVGNGRGYLCALVTGTADAGKVQAALDAVNPGLPHYRQVRSFAVIGEAFTPENGLLTANGKLRRDAINVKYAAEIAAMYNRKQA